MARSPNSASSHLMKIGSERPISSRIWRGIRQLNQPLKSTSTRLCSQRDERMLRAERSQSANPSSGVIHQNRHGWTISPKLCSRDLA